MSYGSAIQTEAVSRINTRVSRSRRDYVRRIVQYEKEFDVNLSRIDTREKSMKDSMIAYSEKMRTIADARNNYNSGSSQNDPLFVRAKHIPKHPVRQPRKRRPMSLDELIGRDRDQKKDKQLKPRPHSDKMVPPTEMSDSRKKTEELHLPVLSDRLRKVNPNLQVSFVSASDLYDIVDFSLRNRGSRQDSINSYAMEKETFSSGGYHASRRNEKAIDRFIADAVYDKYERCERKDAYQSSGYPFSKESNVKLNGDLPFTKRNSSDIYVPTAADFEDKSENVNESSTLLNTNSLNLPKISIDPLRYRPNRVKRMKLQNPGLGAIPEHNVLSHASLIPVDRPTVSTSVSPPPQRMSPRSLATNSNLDSIQEDDSNREHVVLEDQINPVAEEPKSTKRILMRDDGDVRIEVTQCPPKHEPMNTKLKAQKKFKKLIFLRDMK